VIQTLDFFTPVIDDPYRFGRIAAVNSLSDVYAMGGKPVLALNIVCFPNCLDPSVLNEILKGGADAIKEAGAVLLGGHSVEDKEPKYGLSVMGTVHPDHVIANSGAKPGDVLILTKPLGSGILNTATKADMITAEEQEAVYQVMATLNNIAAQQMEPFHPHACTDVTGFGLMGHTLEMALGSDVTIELFCGDVPIIPGTLAYAEMGLVPAGAYKNRHHVAPNTRIDETIQESIVDVLSDPQTSGGLLIALPEDQGMELLRNLKELLTTECACIGRVTERQDVPLIVLP